MRTRLTVLLATGALVVAGASTAAGPQTSHYPWVQPPASGTLPAFPGAPTVQPPASIPAVTTVERPAIAGSSYVWVQPPAWVGTGSKPVPLPPTPAQPWVQPPAFIFTA